MADKIDQLYDALKADGAVQNSRENFRKFFLTQGDEGYYNRKSLYDALKADGAVQSPTYEDFMQNFGWKGVKRPVQQTATPPSYNFEPLDTSPETGLPYFMQKQAGMERRGNSSPEQVQADIKIGNMSRIVKGYATPEEQKKLQKRLGQRMDELEYEQETGNRLHQPVKDIQFEAPTISRDEYGNIRRDENGNPLIGFSTDEDVVNTHRQIQADQAEWDVLSESEKRERANEAKLRAEMMDYKEPTLWDTVKRSLGSGIIRKGAEFLDLMQQLTSGMIVEDPSKPSGYMRTRSYDEALKDKNDPITRATDYLHETSERLSRQAQPHYGKGFLDMLWDGEIGNFLQKGIGTAFESFPNTLSIVNPLAMVANGMMMAGGNYREQVLENPDIPEWKRFSMAVGMAAIEQLTEKYSDPFFKYVRGSSLFKSLGKEASEEAMKNITKEATENIAKRIFQRLAHIGKDAVGEGAEEIISNFGSDTLGEMLDLVDGKKNYGLRAQWAERKKNNPDADLWEFAMEKAKEYSEAGIGGFMAGAYMSGSAQVSIKGLEYALGGKVNAEHIASNPNTRIDPATMEVAQSYDDGYSAEEPNDLKQFNDEAQMAEQNLPQYGEKFAKMVTESQSPVETLDYLMQNREYFTDEQIAAAADYFQKRSRIEGAMDGTLDRIDMQVEQANSEVRGNMHQDSGQVITAQIGDSAYYVIGGDVVTDEATGIPVVTGTGGAVVVKDALTGEVSVKSPQQIAVTSMTPADDMIRYNEEVLRQQLMKQADADYAYGSPANEVYQLEDIVTLQDRDGNIIEGQIGMMPNAVDGVYVVYTPDNKALQYTADQLNRMIIAHNGQEVQRAGSQNVPQTGQMGTDTEEYVPETPENISNQPQPAQSGETTGGEASAENGTGANEPPVSALDRIPILTDEKGQPVLKKGRPQYQWHKASVEDAAAALIETTDGDMVMARDNANRLVKTAKEKLEKIRKQEPKGEDPLELAESSKAIQKQIDDTQATIKQWQDVASSIQKQMNAESERLRQEAEAKKSEEQRQREAAEAAERKKQQEEIDRQRIREQIEKDKERRNKEYQPLVDAREEMADDPDATAILSDTEPRSLDEWVSSLLRPHSMLWQDASQSEIGLQSELGLKRGDMQRMLTLLGTKESGAKPFGQVVLDIHEGLTDAMKDQYTDEDVRQTLLDLFSEGSSTRMLHLTEEHRIEEAREAYQENLRRAAEYELEQWAESNHLTPAERETYEDFLSEDYFKTNAALNNEQEFIDKILADEEQNRRGQEVDLDNTSGTAGRESEGGESQVQRQGAAEETGADQTQQQDQGNETPAGSQTVPDTDVSGGTPQRITFPVREQNVPSVGTNNSQGGNNQPATIKPSEQLKPIDLRDATRVESPEIGVAEANEKARQAASNNKPLSEKDAKAFMQRMEESAVDDPKISLTPESWAQTFGLNNKLETPIGNVKMGESQYQKFFDKKRSEEFGMAVMTLQDPDVVFMEPSQAKEGQTTERPYSYVFVKTFIRDGQKMKYYASVTVQRDNMEVSVSSHVMKPKRVLERLMELERLYTKETLLPNSSEWHLAEQQDAVPDLLPTQGNNVTSEDKDTNNSANLQEKTEKTSQEPQNIAKKPEKKRKPKDDDFNGLQQGKRFVTPDGVIEIWSVDYDKLSVFDIDQEGNRSNETRKIDTVDLADGVKNGTVVRADEKPEPKRLVSDERMEELKKKLRSKIGGQLNVGVDPEILVTGAEMAVGYLERGITKFSDFAKAMIEEVGDFMRPYLKSFYNAVRDMPEAADYADQMDDYQTVSSFDVYNFDKQSTPDAFTKAEQVVKEQKIRKQANKIKQEQPDLFAGDLFDSQKEASSIGITSSPEQIASEEAKVDTNPSEAQKEAGNYQKGHIKVDGYDITIENPKGSVRSGVDANGKAWEQVMNNTYGYIRGTEATDGDHIDVFLSDNPTEGEVFVVDQVKPDGSFDEVKVMYGFKDAAEATQAYLSNYEEGWKGLGAISGVSREKFKEWVNSSRRKTKPFREYALAKREQAKQQQSILKQLGDLQDNGRQYEENKPEAYELGKQFAGTLPNGTTSKEALRLASDALDSNKSKGGVYALPFFDGVTDVIKEKVKRVKNRLKELAARYHSADIVYADLDMPDKELLEVCQPFGLTQKDIDEATPEQLEHAAELVRKHIINTKTFGKFNDISKKLVIFATLVNEDRIDEMFFHENIHEILDRWYKGNSIGIADRFWKNAPEEGGKISKKFIRGNYINDDWSEEFFVTWLGKAMVDGTVGEMHQYLTEDGDIDRLNNLLDEIGYERGNKETAAGEGADRRGNQNTGEQRDTDGGNSSESTGGSIRDEGSERASKNEVLNNSTSDKIEDVGEEIAGARKDLSRKIAQSLDSATKQTLAELPFSKAYKKPDLKKAVEEGALRESDAVFYDAFFSSFVDQNKPRVTKTEERRKKYNPGYKTDLEKWVDRTHQSLQTLKDFVEADEQQRDRIIEALLADKYPFREQELADIEKRKEWNKDRKDLEWGDKTTPNPLWITYEVMKRLDYTPGDKLDIPFGILKADSTGTQYSLYNKKNDRNYYTSPKTVEEGIDAIVWLARLKRGDSDIQFPVSSFYTSPTKSETGENGMFRVIWGSFRNPQTRDFDSKEKAEEFAKTKKAATHIMPLRDVVRRFGYKVMFRNPLTGERYAVNDKEFDTDAEAMQYLDENYDEINSNLNNVLSAKQTEKENAGKKELTADDMVYTAMIRNKDGKYTYGVLIDKKYANNYGIPLVIKDGFATRNEAKEFADNAKGEVFKAYQEYKAKQKAFVYFDTGADSRIGEDYRSGKDVTAEDFMNTFGFRGVQFGNWTNQADRQMAVNQAYDAFLDLAKLIGVSPKAISLNGELGIAFGARGSGNFAAHYEPGEIVINLTKTMGAGSLAHEWWHALDNYFARTAGERGGMVTDDRSLSMRQQLRDAFNTMLNQVAKSPYYSRSKDKGDYWGRMHEVTARLLAEWVNQELKKRGELNTFLSRGAKTEGTMKINYERYKKHAELAGKEVMPFEEYKKLDEAMAGSPYPSPQEVERFSDAMRNVFDIMQERIDEETGNVALYQKVSGTETAAPDSRETALRDALIDTMRDAGILVGTDTEVGQNVLDEVEGNAKTSKEKYFRTKDGRAYGYTYNGKIYIDPSIATSETPIHEYTHLWAEALRRKDPEKWDSIVEVLKNDETVKPFWDKVAKQYPELTDDNDIAEEVLAQYSGKRGSEQLREVADEIQRETPGIFGKAQAVEALRRMKNVLAKFWKAVADMMGWKFTKAEEIADRVLSDLLNGMNPNEQVEEREAPIFVSNAMRAVEGIKQDKATPEQWLKMIEKGGGLKAGEDKWLGLSDWLNDQKDKKSITKQEVMDYIRQNQIQIEEDAYEEFSFRHNEKEFNNEFRELMAEGEEETGSIYTADHADWAFDQMKDKYGDDFEYAFDIQKNGDRWELVPTLNWNDELSGEAKYYLSAENTIHPTRMDYTTQGLDNKREIALTVPTIEPYKEGDQIHFGDAGGGRAVAWIRFGDTTVRDKEADQAAEKAHDMRVDFDRKMGKKYNVDSTSIPSLLMAMTKEERAEERRLADAESEAIKKASSSKKRVLVIDEIQSKRHQDAREKGYKGDVKAEDLEKAREESREYSNYLYDKYIKGKHPGEDFLDYSTDEEKARFRELTEKVSSLVLQEKHGVPDAPFEKNWHELAMKRMLRYAAENGYDKIAWTTGEQQAERYDVGNVVEKIISYDYPAIEDPDGRNSKKLEVRLKDGNTMTMRIDPNGKVIEGRSDTEGKQLSDVVGKDLAKRIINGDGKDGTIFDANRDLPAKVIDGEGLRIGSDGMQGFYDQILPRFMDKYGKKWGVKTGEIELPDLEKSAQKMWSVDVTPEMRKSVMQGQPMFQKATSIDDVAQQADNERPHYQKGENAMDYAERLAEYDRQKKMGSPEEEPVNMARQIYEDAIRDTGDRMMIPAMLASIFNKETRERFKHKFAESWWDYSRSIKALQDAIEKATGKTIQGFEEVWRTLNAKSSIDNDQIQKVMHELIEPLSEYVGNMVKGKEIDGHRMTLDDVEKYMNAVHGIERNIGMAMKQAKDEYEEDTALLRQQLESGELSGNERKSVEDALLIKEARYNGIKDYMDNEVVSKWYNQWKRGLENAKRNGTITEDEYIKAKEKMEAEYEQGWKFKYRSKDYSGLTALFADEFKDEKDKPTEDLLEQAAKDYASNFEKIVGKESAEGLWQRVKALNEWSLRKSYESGLISKDQYNDTLSMYKHYVPLRGWHDDYAGDVYQYISRGEPAEVLQGVLKKAYGRKSRAARIFGTMAAMANTAIIQGNKNLVAQHLLNMAMNHKDAGLLMPSEQYYQKNADGQMIPQMPALNDDMTPDEMRQELERFEADMKAREDAGEVQTLRRKFKKEFPLHMAKWQEQRHAVRVMRNGKEYMVYILGNPRAAEAFNGLLNPNSQPGAISNIVNMWNRWLAKWQTSLSPEFLFSNFQRDVMTATTGAYIKFGNDYKRQFEKNILSVMPLTKATLKKLKGEEVKNLGGIFSLFRKYDSGTLDMNDEMERLFKEFVEGGGMTGISYITKAEEYQESMEKMVRRMRQGKMGKVRKGWEAVGDGIEFLNKGIENATRFATYMTSRQQGRSIRDSIFDAKEASVNFNMKGSGAWGNMMARRLYLYVNPAMQALRMLGTWYENDPVVATKEGGKMVAKAVGKRFLKTAAGVVTASVTCAIVNKLLSELLHGGDGDDDDKEKGDWWALSEWNRYNYINVINPFGKGYFHWSIPQELRPLWAMGQIAVDMAFGRKTWQRGLQSMVLQLNNLSPLSFFEGGTDGGETVIESELRTMTPSFLAPFFDAYFWNRDFMGHKITNRTGFNKEDPEWKRAGDDTPRVIINASRKLNNITGGADNSRGWLEDNILGGTTNPSAMYYLATQQFGGVGSMAKRLFNLIDQATNDEKEVELRNIPFVPKVYVSTGDDHSKQRVLNDKFWMYYSEYKGADHEIKKNKKDVEAKEMTQEYADKRIDERKADGTYNTWKIFEDNDFDYIFDKLRGTKQEVDVKRMVVDAIENGKMPDYEAMLKDPNRNADNDGLFYKVRMRQIEHEVDDMKSEDAFAEFDKTEDPRMRKELAKRISKDAGASEDPYGDKPRSDHAYQYQLQRTAEDVREDAMLYALQEKLRDDDKEREKDDLSKERKRVHSSSTLLHGGRSDDKIMEDIRKNRKDLMEKYGLLDKK